MAKMPFQVVSAQTPEGVGLILCRGMMEFFINHMDIRQAQENFGNFMAAMEDMMLTPQGIEAQRDGWSKLEKAINDSTYDPNHL